VFGKHAGIPEDNSVFIHADLKGNAAAVILMDHGIEQRLTQRGFWEEKSLAPLEPLVADVGLEILRVQEIESLLNLLEETSVHLVLIAEVIIRREEADLDPGPAHIPLGAVRKKQAGGAFEAVSLDELQVAEYDLSAVA
jgi:hypothetical protein